MVHRNQIAKQALKSYRKVFDKNLTMGMVTGKYQDYDADFVFATVQTLSKEENLCRYKKDHWDLIIIDDERVIIRTKLEKPSKIKGLALI